MVSVAFNEAPNLKIYKNYRSDEIPSQVFKYSSIQVFKYSSI